WSSTKRCTIFSVASPTPGPAPLVGSVMAGLIESELRGNAIEGTRELLAQGLRTAGQTHGDLSPLDAVVAPGHELQLVRGQAFVHFLKELASGDLPARRA